MDARRAPTLQKPLTPGHQITEGHTGGTETGRRVVRYIASGAFGDVYEVETDDDQPMREAMKMITLTDKKSGMPLSDAERVRRLGPHVREAHLMLRLGRHPNLVGVRGAFQIGNDFYFFEDLVPGGRTLRGIMRDITLTTEHAAVISFEMAKGLDFMHSKDVVHGDVKPDNILVELVKIAPDEEGGEYGANPAECTGRVSTSCAPSSPRIRSVHDAHLRIGVVKLADFGGGFTPAYASPQTFEFWRSQQSPRQTSLFTKTFGTEEQPEDFDYSEKRARAAASQDEWSWAAVFMEMLTTKIPTSRADVPSSLEGLRGWCFDLLGQCLDSDCRARPQIVTVHHQLAGALTERGVIKNDGATIAELPAYELARLHSNIGSAFYQQIANSQKDFLLAEENLNNALRIMNEEYGKESARYATALNDLAMLREAQVGCGGSRA